MKIPALRSSIGTWVYYVSTLTFKQVSEHVSKVNDELHRSKLLRDMLQRSITDNFKSIAKYIETQEDRFFNALVLAVYDGDPQWQDVRIEYEDGDVFYDLGILELSGEEKIFPIDGQHRVEGIKKVLSESAEFDNERIPVIFIGHKKDDAGMQRARRLFSTLNRYAKPVSMRDIIALDEDDIIAIISRNLLDSHQLFTNDRILDIKNKAIPESNTKAFTTIITFYECNRELLWLFIKDREVRDSNDKRIKGKTKTNEFIKKRPSDNDLINFEQLCNDFWNALQVKAPALNTYAQLEIPNTQDLRNREGGLIHFRPAGLIPLIRAIIRVKDFHSCSFEQAVERLPIKLYQLTNPIWRNVLWNSATKTMNVNNQPLTQLILLFFMDCNLLSEDEISKLKEGLRIQNQLMDIDSVNDLLELALEETDDIL